MFLRALLFGSAVATSFIACTGEVDDPQDDTPLCARGHCSASSIVVTPEAEGLVDAGIASGSDAGSDAGSGSGSGSGSCTGH